MEFRVLKQQKFVDPIGRTFYRHPGQQVTVANRHKAEELMARGIIGPKEDSHKVEAGVSAPPFTRTLRVGLWLATSTHYSGGRIYLYQYAWALANNGAEVWIITDRVPRWQKDYPLNKNLKIAIFGKDRIPNDLDLLVSDCKTHLANGALLYKKNHPNIPFVGVNFETLNWLEKAAPAEAEAAKHTLSDMLKRMNQADYLFSCSAESSKFLDKEINTNGKRIPIGHLHPAVNSHAIEMSEVAEEDSPTRPYVLMSARPVEHKQWNVAFDAIWGMDEVMDFAVFGHGTRMPRDTEKHRIIGCVQMDDLKKFKMIKGAQAVLAPSVFEGYGMVPGEAIACGTPCIAYDIPVLREAYGDKLAFVPCGDKKAFAKMVKKVLRFKQGKYTPTKKELVSFAPNGKELKTSLGLERMASEIDRLPYHAFKRKSITAQLIVYWGFLPETLEAIYPYVDKIAVAYGPTKLVAEMGVEPDGSLKKLLDFPDPDGKIVIQRRDVWADKHQMWKWTGDQVDGNYTMILGGDEIWVGFDKWLEADIPFGAPRWLTFWHDKKHWIYEPEDSDCQGTRWGYLAKPFGTLQVHYRWSPWRKSYRWKSHNMATDYSGSPLCSYRRNVATGAEVPEAVIYHLGHALPKELMESKHDFYLNRDGTDPKRFRRKECWHNWNGKLGECGDGIIAKVDWKLPKIITKAFANMNKEAKVLV